MTEPRDPHERHSSTPSELKEFHAMEGTGEAFLAWRDAEGILVLSSLTAATPPITLGRGDAAGVRVDGDSAVSSVHATIEPLDAVWTIADLGLSTNGTFVNGERITGQRRLRDGDRIQVGRTLIAFHGGSNDVSQTELLGPGVDRSNLNPSDVAVLAALCRPLLFQDDDEPATNAEIARQVYLTEEGVKRCLTRLYVKFSVTEVPKRRRLAQRAISTGVVARTDYSGSRTPNG